VGLKDKDREDLTGDRGIGGKCWLKRRGREENQSIRSSLRGFEAVGMRRASKTRSYYLGTITQKMAKKKKGKSSTTCPSKKYNRWVFSSFGHRVNIEKEGGRKQGKEIPLGRFPGNEEYRGAEKLGSRARKMRTDFKSWPYPPPAW